MGQNPPNPKRKISLKQRENLIEAYHMLHDSVYRRRVNQNTLNAILLPASVVLIGIAIQYKDSINALFPIELHVAGFVPLCSILLLFLSAVGTYSTSQTIKTCFEKIEEIENILGIEAHTYVFSRIRNKWWWKTRKVLWWTVLTLFLALCLISSYLLFK